MSSTDIQLADQDQRYIERLMARARIIAAMPGLKEKIAGNPEAVGAIMLSLEGYGLPTTVVGINNAFDWIEGRAEPSAQMYQALANNDGWQLREVELTASRAVVEISRPGYAPERVTFDLDDAKAAHRLDEWVEQWRDSGGSSGKKYPVRYVVRVDGANVNEPWPEWAADQVARGFVKRYDAWWNYRKDMLYKSAAKRAVKRACPAALLGGSTQERALDDTAHSFVSPAAPADSPAGEARSAPEPAAGETNPAEDVVDAETVDGADLGVGPARPPSPKPQGEGPPATTGSSSAQQGGPAGAPDPPKRRRRLSPARELVEVHGEGLDQMTVKAVVFSSTNGASDRVENLTLSAYSIAADVLDRIRCGRYPDGWDDLTVRYHNWLAQQQSGLVPDGEPF